MPSLPESRPSIYSADGNSTDGERASDSLSVLFLYTHPLPEVDAIIDHVEALTLASRHHVCRINMISQLPPRLDLDRFDVIVIHYSITICLSNHLCAESYRRICESKPLKVLFIQDEYRHVNATVNAIGDLGIDLLFTCVPEPEIEKVYCSKKLPGVRKVNVLTGYVSNRSLKKGRPPRLANRPIDVGYRARRVPTWLGQLGREKWEIGKNFLAHKAASKLKCDISALEEDRLYGAAWGDFLHNCRAVLGVESGASVFDFSGEIQARVEAAEAENPSLTHAQLEAKYFPDLEGKIRLNQISPRCFEAAVHGTVMILYEGEYSGRLKSGRHFIPLKKDHSNMDEVIATLLDGDKAQAIADWAWEEVACARENSYDAFTKLTDNIITEQWTARSVPKVKAYDDQTFSRDSAHSWSSKFIFFKRFLGWRIPILKRVANFFRN